LSIRATAPLETTKHKVSRGTWRSLELSHGGGSCSMSADSRLWSWIRWSKMTLTWPVINVPNETASVSAATSTLGSRHHRRLLAAASTWMRSISSSLRVTRRRNSSSSARSTASEPPGGSGSSVSSVMGDSPTKDVPCERQPEILGSGRWGAPTVRRVVLAAGGERALPSPGGQTSGIAGRLAGWVRWAGCGIPPASLKGYHTPGRGQSHARHAPISSRAASGLPRGRAPPDRRDATRPQGPKSSVVNESMIVWTLYGHKTHPDNPRQPQTTSICSREHPR
jgi:hypothetical protein